MKRIKNQIDLLMVLSLAGVVPALVYYLVEDKTIFLGLSWNTFLALLPFYFAIKATTITHKGFKYFNAFLWLLFLPNAPYIITDLIHVEIHKDSRGFLIYLVAVLSFTGLLSWLFSVRLMLARMPGMLHKWKTFTRFSYILLCLLSGIGVAMGRFARLNSWEVFYQPKEVLMSTIYMYTDVLPWIITLGIALILFVVGHLNIWIKRLVDYREQSFSF